MPHGYQRIYKNISYLRKAHFCPDCGTKLEKAAVSKEVNARSLEAKNFDFSIDGVHMIGDVRFTWDELECPSCKKHLTVDEMKKIEGIDPSKTGVFEKVILFIMAILFLVVVFLMNK